MSFVQDDEPEISRDNPTCFLFLVDQSYSMAKPWGRQLNRSKAQGVADAINGLIYALIDRCAMGQEVYDRYYVGVVGYGGDKEDRNYVSLGFPVEALAGGVSRPISEIARNPFRIEQRVRKVSDGTGKLVEETVESPVWFEPVALGYTPMCRALQVAQEVVLQFISEHPTCFPPVVFNVTDGAANDGDPEPFAAQLRAIACGGRNVMPVSYTHLTLPTIYSV